MISPLQTWQHHDPKGLWPALSGLAVLAHVGAIGMSVPYLLSWQAAGEQSAAAIPIELVAIAPSEFANSMSPDTTTSEDTQPAPQNSQSRNPSTAASAVPSKSSPVSIPVDRSPSVSTITEADPTEVNPAQASPNSTISSEQANRGQVNLEQANPEQAERSAPSDTEPRDRA